MRNYMRAFYGDELRSERTNLWLRLCLFIVYPFLAFLYSLSDIKSKYSYVVFGGICILFGITFIAEYEVADSFRYAQDFIVFAQHPYDNLVEKVTDYFSGESNVKDLFIYFVYYISAICGGSNYHIMFFFVSVVFTLFYLKSLSFLTTHKNFRNSFSFILLLFLFTYSNPIFNINGIRFWTAAWLAVYFSFQIIIKERLYYILCFVILPMIHGAFTLYVAFFLVAFCCRNLKSVLPFFFVLSLLTTNFILDYIHLIREYLPKFLQNMIWAYTESETAVAKINSTGEFDGPLYARILNALPHYYIMLLIWLEIKTIYKSGSLSEQKRLSFVVAYQTLVNVCVVIPSIVRFNALTIPFVVYLWISSYDLMKKWNKVLLLIPFVYSYSLLYWFRNMCEVTDPFLLMSNSIHLFLKNLL